MTKPKTYKKQKSCKKNTAKTFSHKPLKIFEKMKIKDLYEELAQCLKDRDQDSFKEILWAYLKAHDKKSIAKKMGVSRTTLYRMVSDDGNPTLENIMNLLDVLDEAA